MDMRKYSSGVIKPEDLHEGPRVEKIVNVFEHEKHGCLVLEFESGDQFYCWNNYARILSKAWGYESDRLDRPGARAFARALHRQENRSADGKRNHRRARDLAEQSRERMAAHRARPSRRAGCIARGATGRRIPF